jgi:hypothetical protein
MMAGSKRDLTSAIALVLVLSATPVRAEERSSSIGYASVEDALAALRADPTATESAWDGWALFVRSDGREFWSFTPESHPAHPSAAKRTAYQDDNGAWHVDTRMLCQSTKASCDALMEEYRQLDERMKVNIQRRHGSGT